MAVNVQEYVKEEDSDERTLHERLQALLNDEGLNTSGDDVGLEKERALENQWKEVDLATSHQWVHVGPRPEVDLTNVL